MPCRTLHRGNMETTEHDCKGLPVAEEICYVRFAGPDAVAHHSEQLSNTVRGEMVIADYDDRGRIIGLELLGGGKPCQQMPSPRTSER